MSETRDWKTICLFATLHWFATIAQSFAYFQAPVGGYLFTVPGFSNVERGTQVNAQKWCNGNQSKLLEITSGDIQNSVVRFINNAISQSQMTVNSVITSGKKIDIDLNWVNGIGHSSSFCAIGFVTYGRCYKSYSEKMSWFEARNRCTDGKGDLASFDFIADNSGFGALNGSGWNPPSTYWIGLTRQKWTWPLSSSDVVYSQWFGGHPIYSTNPNKDCLCLLPNNPTLDWKWSECDCSQTYQFVCMTGPETGSSSNTQTHISPSTTGVISSTTREAAGGTTQSFGVSSLFSSLENVSATGLQYSTPSSCTCAILAVGLCVGLGVGIPMAIFILILALIIVQHRRKIKSMETNRNIPSDGTPMEVKAGDATTYESFKEDGQRGDPGTYEELSAEENRQTNEAYTKN